VVENHKLYFDITYILNVVLRFFFQQNMGLCCNLDSCFQQKNTNFYSEFYVHLLCGFLVMLNYDEMNCNLVFGIFYNVF
jgi:hypothetical protein